MQTTLTLLIISHATNQVLVKNQALLWWQLFNMSAILAAILDFFENCMFNKSAASFFEFTGKQVFICSNRKTFKKKM